MTTIILIVVAITLATFILVSLFTKMLKNEKEENNKLYILNVITNHSDGGQSSHWHGWSDKWKFTYEEAIEKKQILEKIFDEVQMLEYEEEQERVNDEVNTALEYMERNEGNQ